MTLTHGADGRDDIAARGIRPSWEIVEVDWSDERGRLLREAMDIELSARYGDRMDDLDPVARAAAEGALTLDPSHIAATILALDADGTPVGHAALRDLRGDLEVKRVYVAPQARGRGASRALMAALERIALRFGVSRLILQTGDRQPDAVALYEHIGYTHIPIFEPYTPISFSICMAKPLV